MTRSENLFAALCQRLRYCCTAIPEKPEAARRTPDYRVSTPFGDLIAEVKELQPNPEDRETIRLQRTEVGPSGSDTIGHRARKAIRDAANQLKVHRDERVPMLVVLYDNVRTEYGRFGYPVYFLESASIDAAMYGDRKVLVRAPDAEGVSAEFNGGHRTTTAREKRYISAVLVISDHDDVTTYVYHNIHAERPLPAHIFVGEKCFHCRKSGDGHQTPWQWTSGEER